MRSDEIAVYDVEGDKLVEHLRFEPGGERAVFQRRHVGDVDDDGRAELVGGFARAGRLGGALVPFAIDWDDGAGRYRLISLQAERPALARIKIRDAVAAGVRPSYRRPVSFRDERPAYRRELRGFRAHDFAVTPPPERLLVGYLIEPRNQENGPRLEVAPFQFRKTEGRPHVVPCERRDLRKPLKVAVAVDRPPTAAMLEEWGKLDDEGRRCKPVLAAPPTP